MDRYFQSFQRNDPEEVQSPSDLPSAISIQPRKSDNNSNDSSNKKEPLSKQLDELVDTFPKSMCVEQDASCMRNEGYRAFGDYVAMKLEKCTTRQSILAEKFISDVLFKAGIGSLEESVHLCSTYDKVDKKKH